VQDARGRVETAVLHGGREGAELVEVGVHVSQANAAVEV
jgi:hypothetical protein